MSLPLRVSNEGLPRPRVARAQETIWPALSHSLQACSLFLQGWGLIDLLLRVFSEGLLSLHFLQREQANHPSLRASNEHIFIVRVLRARRIVACSLTYPSSALLEIAPYRSACGRKRQRLV